jgi:hypothetical protein
VFFVINPMLQLYKEAGGLQVLTELITDKTSSLAEEMKGQDKDDKGKKSKSSKADGGRKSRIVDAECRLRIIFRLV